jgi:hypothetical protein
MVAPERGALTLVRVIGVILVVWAILDLGLYWFQCHSPRNPAPVQVITVLLKLIPAVIGIVVLVKARAIAEWVKAILDL